MTYITEFPIAKLDIMNTLNDSKAQQILERIKNVPLHGKAYRGYPTSVEIKDIVKYRNKNGQHIFEGPCDLDKNYLAELAEQNGTLSKDTIGKIYWLSTTHPNLSMSDPVTGVSTGFQYRKYNDGTENLYFDAIPFGSTHFLGKPEVTKTNNTGLRKIIETINPTSKLI